MSIRTYVFLAALVCLAAWILCYWALLVVAKVRAAVDARDEASEGGK